MTGCLNFFAVFSAFCSLFSKLVGETIKGYDLPVLPAKVAPEPTINFTHAKLIPRIIWVAVKDKNDPYPSHLDHLFNRNPLWEKRVCDNECKEDFMNKASSNDWGSGFMKF
jgi:hypothetical protein